LFTSTIPLQGVSCDQLGVKSLLVVLDVLQHIFLRTSKYVVVGSRILPAVIGALLSPVEENAERKELNAGDDAFRTRSVVLPHSLDVVLKNSGRCPFPDEFRLLLHVRNGVVGR
jgi:hypothetical protein